MAIEAAGYSTWWDQRIQVGTAYDDTIERELDSAKCVLVVWSRSSVESEWVRNEASEGLRRGILLPIRVDESAVPLEFRRRQTYDICSDDDIDDVVGAAISMVDQGGGDARGFATRQRRVPNFSRVALVVIGGLAIIIAGQSYLLTRDQPQLPATQSPISLEDFPSEGSTYHSRFALSPDGSQIAYIGMHNGATALYVKEQAEVTVRRVPNTSGALAPFYSPDGGSIGFFLNGEVMQVGMEGNDIPNSIGVTREANFKLSWGRNGSIAFTPSFRSGLSRMDSTTGQVHELTTLNEGDINHLSPEWLPDDRGLLYQVFRSEFAAAQIWVLSGGQQKYVIDGSWPIYVDGFLLFFKRAPTASTGSIYRVRFDLDSLSVVGEPEQVASAGPTPFDVSRNESLIYLTPGGSAKSRLIVQYPDLTRAVIDLPATNYGGPRISSDERFVAVEGPNSPEPRVLIHDLTARNAPTLLPTENNRRPVWSPDQSQIAYWEIGQGLRLRSKAAEDDELVVQHTDWGYPLQWTPRGLIYLALNRETFGDLYFRSNGGEVSVIDARPVRSVSAQISPDEKWIAMGETQLWRDYSYIKAYPVGQRRWDVPIPNASWPKWSEDGTMLYAASLNRIVRLRVKISDDGITFGEPEVVAEIGTFDSLTYDPFDVSNDGLLVYEDRYFDDPPKLVLVNNWSGLVE